MDPFEVRMQFLSHLRRLNASQQSIQKVVSFAVRYFPGCGEDLWDCIVEECQKGTINSRINILYFLDSLCETCLLLKSHSSTATGPQYVDFVSRDLGKIVESVVPEGRRGLPNLTSTKQILESWRSKRVVDPQKVDEAISSLDVRSSQGEDPTAPNGASQPPPHSHSSRSSQQLPRIEVQKRIEEDRERHKRLRERRWVQPISHKPSAYQMSQVLLSFLPNDGDGGGEEEMPIDIEFENEWETTSDWNEDDGDAAAEELLLCQISAEDKMVDVS